MAKPLMAGEAGIGSFHLAALLIQFGRGTRHNTFLFRAGLRFYQAVLHGSVGGRTEPTSSLCVRDADGRRVSKLKHAVQGLNGDSDLRRATPVRPRTQCLSDHSFKPADS